MCYNNTRLKNIYLSPPAKDVLKGDAKMGNSCINSRKLSHVLLDSGFLPMFSFPTKWGTPFSWDYNNGITVVYDEMGRPWVIQGRDLLEKVERNLIREFSLLRGAFVPNSSDGGKFAHDSLAPYFRAVKAMV